MALKLPWPHTIANFIRQSPRRAILLAICLIVYASGLSIGVQLLYPHNRALPNSKIANAALTFKDEKHINQALQKLDEKQFNLKLANKTYQVTPKSAGLTFATNQNVTRVVSYSFKQRLIPFSMFFQHKVSVQNQLQPQVNIAKATSFANKVTSESDFLPNEGAITVQNGIVTAHSPKPGIQFGPSTLIAALKNIHNGLPKQITIEGKPVPPQFTDANVQAAAAQAKQLVNPFNLTVANKNFAVSKDTVGSWLTFTPNPSTKNIDVSFNNGAIKSYLDGLAKQFYAAPARGTGVLVDNVLSSEQGGSDGAYLNTVPAATAMATALMAKQPSTTFALTAIPRPLNYVHTYSATSKGLQTQLNDWVAAHHGPTWGISIVELGGKSRSASYNGSTSFLSASIYKLYVSYSAQTRIAAGTLDPNTATSTGQSVATCLDLMIINSDNNCAVAIGNMIGWGTITAEARAAGFGSTNVAPYNEYTTASNTTLFLEKLASGSLMDSTQSAALISRMKQQIYRNGLPTGSSGAAVADKVGFVLNYTHDAGIIYSPYGTYVISAFSQGGSWAQIANLATTINSYIATH